MSYSGFGLSIRELAEEGSEIALFSQAGNYDERCQRQYVGHKRTVIVSRPLLQSHSGQCGLRSGLCTFMGLCTIQIRLLLQWYARALDSRCSTLDALRRLAYHWG